MNNDNPPLSDVTPVPSETNQKTQTNICICKCHLMGGLTDKVEIINSCAHCQKKQVAYPNLNAGNKTRDNKWAEKWKTSEERIIACEQYCAYLRQGRSKKFYPAADENTIKRYMETYPEDFRPEKIEDAERKGLSALEGNLIAASLGKVPGANATLLIWLSKNKLGMKDKLDLTSDDRPIEPGWRKPDEQ